VTGSANADCIEQLGQDELGDYLGDYLGALSPATMRSVDEALAVALAL
jgi:mRNA interferase MazF